MIRVNFIEVGANVEENRKYDEDNRFQQWWAADQFVWEGVVPDWAAEPAYGKEWNREYNPAPYPEAVVDEEMYDGTGVGFLYGMDSSVDDTKRKAYDLQMAGWTLTRDGVEVRRTQTKVDKKELVPEGER